MAIPVIYQLITMVILMITDECEGAFYRADARGGSL